MDAQTATASATTSAPTSARLLEAAARLFTEHGYADTAMDQVRQAAGVSNGSLYHHFPTKALLAQALYAATLREFHAALLVPLKRAADAEAGVTGLVRAHIAWVVKHPQRAALLHQLKRHGDVSDASAAVSAANADGFGALKAWVDGQTKAGAMRALPFHVWMAVVFAPTLSLTERWVSAPQPAVKPDVRAALAHAAWSAVAP